MAAQEVFVTGGTGYLGSRLIPALLARGHRVRALVRPGSERKLPQGCEAVPGNALADGDWAGRVPAGGTFVHLVGVSHPSPWKADQFEAVDLASVRASAAAASRAGVAHFVYLSVAHPAPVMTAYWGVRARCEEILAETGLPATFVRPWYVLGPGHRWPYLLIPMYALAERLPGSRETARRLGLVRLPQMLRALVWAVENPPRGTRALEVEQIRERGGLGDLG